MMIDETVKTGNPYHNQVNITENYEVEYWAARFNTTPEQLKKAVKTVGAHSADVKAYLNK